MLICAVLLQHSCGISAANDPHAVGPRGRAEEWGDGAHASAGILLVSHRARL